MCTGREADREAAACPYCDTDYVGTEGTRAAKFPDAVERAIGIRPELPPHLAELFDRPEELTPLPNDLAAVEGFVRSVTRRSRSARPRGRSPPGVMRPTR